MPKKNDEKHKKVAPNAEVLLLVKKAKKGDETAYSEIVKKYRMSVYYLILKMVKNNEDAEDLTFEVFSKVYFNLDMYVETGSFSTWLFKIASNHSIDFLRKQKTLKNQVKIDQPLYKKTNLFLDLASNDPNPETLMMIKQKEKYIRQMIMLLPDDTREIMTMRVFEEASYKEIAEKLGVAIGTVKAKLYKGRNLLARMLEKKFNS